MFIRKKIKEVKKEVEKNLDYLTENDRLRELIISKDREIHKLEDRIEEIIALQEKKPEGCTPGKYCKSCEFAKKFRHSTGVYIKEYYVCGKGNICSEFVQKER